MLAPRSLPRTKPEALDVRSLSARSRGGPVSPDRLFDDAPYLGTAHISPGYPETELVAYVDGCSVDLVVHGGSVPQGGGKRDVVSGFSRQSRTRLIRFMGSINQTQYKSKQIAFISLTYHEKWPDDPDGWKKHLQAWEKRMDREYGDLPGVWKLEFQKRGAPHFHLILFLPLDLVHNPSDVSRLKRFVARTWNEIAGYGSTEHIAYGSDVRFKGSWRGVMSYTAKYMSKEQLVAVTTEDGRVMRTGRCWGYWHKTLLPIEEKRISISWDDYILLRRWFRRLRRRPERRWVDRPYRYKRTGMLVLLSWSSLVRLMEWLGYYPNSPPDVGRGGGGPAAVAVGHRPLARRKLAGPVNPLPPRMTGKGVIR